MKSEIEYFLMGKLNEECGVFGVFNVDDATQLTYYGLHALQHRGQEGAGIVSSDGETIYKEKGEGLVSEVFNSENLSKLHGNISIGHVRYSTTGGKCAENVQPIFIRSLSGDFAIAHNGNIVNTKELKMELESKGSIFYTTSDSEIIGHLIQRESGDFFERILKALPKLEGAFSFLIMNKDALYVIRDKNGLRPLSMGKLDQGYVFSSESSAFEIIGAKYLRAINSGEVLKVTQDGVESKQYTEDTQKKMCAMEYIYFSRPDSDIKGLNVHTSRRHCGQILAKENPANGDIIIGVPDSSLSAAMGFADVSGLPYEIGLIKSRYVGRTFIKPTQQQRERGVKMKLSAVKSVVEGKRIVLVDDSIVRGTTAKHIVQLLRDAGAKEVHMRVAAPPIISPCFYGVDISEYGELISAHYEPKELAQFIGVDSLFFLSHQGLIEALSENICTACFTGQYPTNMFSLLENSKELNLNE